VIAGKAEEGAEKAAVDGKPQPAEEDKPGDGDEEEEDYGDGTILEFTPHYSYICGLRQVRARQPNSPVAPALWLVALLVSSRSEDSCHPLCFAENVCFELRVHMRCHCKL